jgi:hypothetical protein
LDISYSGRGSFFAYFGSKSVKNHNQNSKLKEEW